MFKAEFLSGFCLQDSSGRSIKVPVAKARALFAFLALNAGRAHRRATLADLLWDAPSDRHARQSLRRCFSDLRKAIGKAADKMFLVEDDRLGVVDNAVEVDAITFRRLVALGECAAAVTLLRDDDLLPGLESNVEAFDDWLANERRLHSEMAAEACLVVAEQSAKDGQITQARNLAERCLRQDPYSEAAHRLLIDVHLQSGRPDAARRQYEKIVQLSMDRQPFNAVPTVSAGDAPQHRYTSNAQPIGLRIHCEAISSLGGDNLPQAIGEGLQDDLRREIARHRMASVTLDPRSTGYAIGGSIRSSGRSFKASLRLVDVADGSLIWSEAFTGSKNDLFSAEQSIAVTAASRIMSEIAKSECRQNRRQRPVQLSAYAVWQLGRERFWRFTKQDNEEARRLCNEAIRLAPEFAAPYVTLSEVEARDAFFGYSDRRQTCLDRAVAMAKTAITIDQSNPGAHAALARALALLMDFDGAILAARSAADLCPSLSDAHFACALAHYYAGRPRDAIEAAQRATQIDPLSPLVWSRYQMMARSSFDMERYDDALQFGHKASAAPNAEHVALALKAASAQKVGQTKFARLVVRDLMNRHPDFTSDYVYHHLGNERIQDRIADLADTLSMCGVPPS